MDLWAAALEQVQRENQKPLAFIRETLPAAEFNSALSEVTRERSLVEKLLTRNQTSLSLPSVTFGSEVELVDATSIRKADGVTVDWTMVRTRFALRKMRLVRLSLPVFSDDGMRALVAVWTTGGFDDGSGGGYVFQKKQGSWIVVDYLALWIT